LGSLHIRDRYDGCPLSALEPVHPIPPTPNHLDYSMCEIAVSTTSPSAPRMKWIRMVR
jgi:hypothetical protein